VTVRPSVASRAGRSGIGSEHKGAGGTHTLSPGSLRDLPVGDLAVVASAAVPATTGAPRLRKAVGAVDRLITPWLERHPGLIPTARAGGGEHLAILAAIPSTATRAVASAAGAVPTRVVAPGAATPPTPTARAAILAARRIAGEALLREELLLPSREDERLAAVAAGQSFVAVTQR